MVNVRRPTVGSSGLSGSPGGRGARFNVLLTEDREPSHEHWTVQLPRLLEPQGVQSFVARTSREAMEVVATVEIHAAVIDIATPADDLAGSAAGAADEPESAGGLLLLEVFRRLPSRPPVVVVNNILLPPREAQRLLVEALRLGAFSVVERPTDPGDLLAVMRRVVDRRYHGHWPDAPPSDP